MIILIIICGMTLFSIEQQLSIFIPLAVCPKNRTTLRKHDLSRDVQKLNCLKH